MDVNERMETEYPLDTFSNQYLHGLIDATGVSDPQSLVNGGINLEFCKFAHTICTEICGLCQMPDMLSAVEDDTDIEGFFFELSAFLGELDCPYELITCGPLPERLNSPEKITLLLEYLFGELKAARLAAVNRLHKPLSLHHENQFATIVSRTAQSLNAAEVLSNSNPLDIIREIHNKANLRLQSCVERPKPLFTATMDAKKWGLVEQVAQTLSQDCRSRNLLLMKRIDVTINSFLWSDRVKKSEDTIRKMFSARRDEMAQVATADAAGLLAATSDLLRVEHVSSLKRRQNTRSKMHPLAMSTPPVDRGGRTNEIPKLKNENYANQFKEQHGRGRGGGYHPRSQHQQGGFNQTRSVENEIRSEFERRDGSGRGRGNFQRGRGRGRGQS